MKPVKHRQFRSVDACDNSVIYHVLFFKLVFLVYLNVNQRESQLIEIVRSNSTKKISITEDCVSRWFFKYCNMQSLIYVASYNRFHLSNCDVTRIVPIPLTLIVCSKHRWGAISTHRQTTTLQFWGVTNVVLVRFQLHIARRDMTHGTQRTRDVSWHYICTAFVLKWN